MTRPRSITCGDGDTEARVEYLKSRRVLRLTSGPPSGGRELTVEAFCDELGIRPEVVTAPTYLLFAGSVLPPGGGCRDLVATYLCPDEARREFTAWRRDPGCAWAELVRLVAGTTATVCWFGVDRADRTADGRAPAGVPSRPRRWVRVRRTRRQDSSRA